MEVSQVVLDLKTKNKVESLEELLDSLEKQNLIKNKMPIFHRYPVFLFSLRAFIQLCQQQFGFLFLLATQKQVFLQMKNGFLSGPHFLIDLS